MLECVRILRWQVSETVDDYPSEDNSVARIMCPERNRTYPEETLAFCVVDGAMLSAPYDLGHTPRIPVITPNHGQYVGWFNTSDDGLRKISV